MVFCCHSCWQVPRWAPSCTHKYWVVLAISWVKKRRYTDKDISNWCKRYFVYFAEALTWVLGNLRFHCPKALSSWQCQADYVELRSLALRVPPRCTGNMRSTRAWKPEFTNIDFETDTKYKNNTIIKTAW